MRDCGKCCKYHLTSIFQLEYISSMAVCVSVGVVGCRDKLNLSKGRRSSCQGSRGGYLCAVLAAEDTEPATG